MDLRRWGFLLCGAGPALVVLLLANAAGASPFPVERDWSRHLPAPASLRPAVYFWKQVFTRYRTRQAVIHDEEHPELIYGAVDLGGPWRATLDQRRELRRARERVRGWLRALAGGRGELVPAQERRRIESLFLPLRGRYSYGEAASNVRIQVGLRETFREGLVRAGRYLPRMRAIFRREGVPEEITLLPLVESAFNTEALSWAGAAGIWQFTRGTGRLFLRVGYAVDERRDPILSTEAAAKHLKQAHEELGTWPLAITAYNHGIAGMRRAVASVGSRDIGVIARRYRGPRFGFASKSFYAEFLAALEAAREHRRHFGEVASDPPLRFDTFPLPDFLSIGTLTRRFPLSVEEVRRLNPALRPPIFQGRRFIPRGYPLRVAPGKGELLARAYAGVPTGERLAAQPRPLRHRVEPGESLSAIARRFGVSVDDLMAANELRASRIYAGQALRIPPRGPAVAERATPPAPGRYRVKRGESLAVIARLHGVSVDELKAANGLRGSRIHPGQALRIPQPPPKDALSRPATAAPATPAAAPAAPPKAAALREARERAEEKRRELAARAEEVARRAAEQAERARERAREVARRAAGPPPAGTLTVRPEETLGHYAEWLKVRAADLRRLNGLRMGRPLRVGQTLRVPFARVSAEEFEAAREEYHAAVREDFNEKFRVSGTVTHAVRKGETLWRIAQEVYEVPTWLLHQYNPGKDLNELSWGETLVVPVVVPR